MTRSDARKILKLQEEEERRTEIVKAAKQHQKIYRRTRATKRPHETILKTSKLITSKDSLPSRKSLRPRKAKKFEDDVTTSDESSDTEESIITEESKSEYEEEEYFCKKCKGEYKNGELWLQCDKCECWFHAGCTNMRKHTKKQIDSLDLWHCDEC